jgi:hypothetical protein
MSVSLSHRLRGRPRSVFDPSITTLFQFLDVQRTKIIARFGLMHMIATNLCEWLFVLIEETQHDIYKSAKKRQDNAARDNVSLSEVDFQFLSSNTFRITKQLYEHKVNCLRSDVMEPILIKSEPYLAPCTVEYSLLCAVILGLMWKNAQADEDRGGKAVEPNKRLVFEWCWCFRHARRQLA